MSKILLILRRLLIYLAVITIALSASGFLMMVSAPKAQAAESPTKTVPAPKLKVVETSQETLPGLKVTKGFSENMTYHQGEKIKVSFVFDGKVLRAWAKVGLLDANFPETLNLKNQGDGGWLLETSALTEGLNVGNQFLKIYAENARGTNVFSFLLSLAYREIKIVPKTFTKENEIHLAWQPVKVAQKYLVQWNAQGETVFHLKVVETTNITLENLVPGTLYEIEITPIGSGGTLGQPQKMTLTTLGRAPVQAVAGVKKITPAIGGGVSTKAPQVAQKETKKEEPAPQESPKPTEGTTGGWNRILVALAILIIAAGAAIGGYYGYEWYAAKSRDEEPPAPKSSSRW